MQHKLIAMIFMGVGIISHGESLLDSPQKIIYDLEHNRYLVSNYGSQGDLVQINYQGRQTYFVENADMIDGMVIVGDVVYGSGIGGTVMGYNLDTGDLVMNLHISGAAHVGGFAVDSLGILFTSERWGDRIFKINPATQTYWVFAQGNGILEPNGLLCEDDNNRLLVCLDQTHPPILAISLLDSTVSTVVTTSLAGSDGITRDRDGLYYITGYDLPGIYKFSPDFSGEPELFFVGPRIIYPFYRESTHSILFTYYSLDDWGEIFLDPAFLLDIEQPESSKLLENFPNPFNPSTTIHYGLPERSVVNISIYDIQGREVISWAYTGQQAGWHDLQWSGTNQFGTNVAAGLYFTSLRAGTYTKTIKMLYTK